MDVGSLRDRDQAAAGERHGAPTALPHPPPAAAGAHLPSPFETKAAQRPRPGAARPRPRATPSPQPARAPLLAWVRHWAEAPTTRMLARCLVCAYFLNLVASSILAWHFFRRAGGRGVRGKGKEGKGLDCAVPLSRARGQ
jgi:hypothetical protein